MADVREQILAQLVTVCTAIDGVTACVRNRLDQNLARPAIIVLDGSEVVVNAPAPQRSPAQEIQRMGVAPSLTLLVRANGSADAGAILSLYRSRVITAVMADSTMIGLVGTNGLIRYDGCTVATPEAEGPEYRMDVAFTFVYVLALADLVENP